MKRLLSMIFLVLVLALAIGCLPTPPPPAGKLPIAFIDSVSAARVSPGETITFTGHGIDPDGGSIAAYNWRSSLDGPLSTAVSFKASSLSEGTHTIWFKVQNSSGAWSKDVSCNVIVLPSGVVIPVISLFEAIPSSIAKGESATLRWNISSALTVRIDPDVGNVALAGNRVVSPTTTTVYTLTATNQAGIMTATTGVAVTSVPTHTVELFSIPAEDGTVRRDGNVEPEPKVGDSATDVAMQAFLSFDISAIPQGATIKSVSLDLTLAETYGSPFTMLGRLYIYSCQYTELRSRDFVEGPVLPGAIYWTAFMPTEPLSSSLLVDAIQTQVDAVSNRFQVRLQFEKSNYYYHVADYLALRSDKTKLIIHYLD
jgi:hypothetical protein